MLLKTSNNIVWYFLIIKFFNTICYSELKFFLSRYFNNLFILYLEMKKIQKIYNSINFIGRTNKQM